MCASTPGPEAGAQCGSAARWDLHGGPPARAVPTVILDDPVLFEPFRAYFHPSQGRPSVPMETFVRMMVLKYRYRLGYETVCAEVSGSISWRLSCKVPLGAAVPHPSTLEKITSRCGEEAIAGLNEALLKKRTKRSS
jgi:IS5 family transposase